MRSTAMLTVLATMATAALCQNAACGEDSLVSAVAKARRELEMLKIEKRLFWDVEYRRELRGVDTAIRLTQAEIDALEDRVRHYRQYERSKTTSPHGPYWEDLQEAELALLEAKLRLGNLMAERRALRQSASDRCRLLELRIAATRAELAGLERLRLPANVSE